MSLIHYDFPFAEAPPALAVPEDSGADWIVGTMRCFASIGAAALVVASALSAQIDWSLQQSHQDEVPIGLSIDEESYSIPCPWVLGTPPVQAAVDDEVLPLLVVAGTPEEDYWTSPAQVATTWTSLLWLLDDSPPFVVDEEYWLNFVQPSIPANVLLPKLVGAEDEITVFLPLDEEPWHNDVLPISGWPYIVLPTWLGADDEITQPPPPLQVEDEYWLQLVAPVPAALRVSLPVALGMDEEITQGLNVEEEYWLHYLLKHRAHEVIVLPAWAGDQESAEAPQIHVDEEYKLPVILMRLDQRWPNPWDEIDVPPLFIPAIVVTFPTPPTLLRKRRTRRTYTWDE